MPLHGTKRPGSRRFLGNPNAAGGWQVTCQRCNLTSKIITVHAHSRLPPNIIIKKLTRLGWRIGGAPSGDLCPECQRRPVQSHYPLAKKALDDLKAPLVTNGAGHVVPYAEVEALAKHLSPEQAKQLIETLRQQLREQIPQKPRREKPPPSPPESPTEYSTWLNEVDPRG